MSEQTNLNSGTPAGIPGEILADAYRRPRRQLASPPQENKAVKEHKEFVQSLVAYFKKSAATDSEWPGRWQAIMDNEKNGDSYLNF